MVQGRCDVRISWRTQLFSLLTHGVLILLILISPWPAGYGPIWLVLLTLVVFECIRSQKRIASRQGELLLLENQRLGRHGPEGELLK
ncbi:protein YgfX, partial [Serratia quinivorans]